jgi:hypothetical protein
VGDMPSDLKVLPTMPYEQRPEDLPLDVEECRTAIWLHNGNITEAAVELKIPSARLRRFVKNNAYLSAEVEEAREKLKDRAEEVIRQGLNDPEEMYTMARYVMSGIGKDRGFGANAGKGLSVTNNGGNIVIQWADGSGITPTTIEGEVIDA